MPHGGWWIMTLTEKDVNTVACIFADNPHKDVQNR